MTDSFTHLHVHTEYSMLDGAAKVVPLVAEAKRLGMPALAITDHGNMFGAYAFYQAAKAAGIKPIIGIEAYVAPLDRFTTKPITWGHPGQRDDDVSAGGAYTHMTLLARNATGLRNLFRLSTLASLEGFYRKPRCDRELLARYGEGVIATTGCASGEVQTRVRLGQQAEARQAAGELQDIFGADNFYLELMDHGIEIERRARDGLLQVERALGIPPIATNDSHYVTRDQAAAHEILLCVQSGKTLTDPDRFHFDGDGYYLKSAEEMRALWAEIPHACDNTLRVTDQVEDYAEVFAPRDLMPRADVPTGYTDVTWLRDQACAGLQSRFGGRQGREYDERLTYELRVIEDKGFSGYFLVVADIVNYARVNGIQVGPGRGSAAGSLVSYALGITQVDPIEHGLLFERMLNPERASMPDIDLDFDIRRRGDMIRYVVEKYGSDRVCQIITFGAIGAKAALKDAGRVLGLPYAVGDRLTKAFPRMQMGREIDLDTVTNPKSPRYAEAGPVRELLQNDPQAKLTYDAALGIEGFIRQAGVHAGGVIISSEPLLGILPAWRHENGQLVSGWDMNEVDQIGLLKMDFLGLRNLTVIDEAVKNVRRSIDPDFKLAEKIFTDGRTYDLLARGDTLGVFQLDALPMRRLLQSMVPTGFADIVASIALYRPGPMGANAHNDYADRKNGRKPVVAIHPELAEPLAAVLEPTYGLIVYQEQVLEIVQRVAGYTLGRADMLRKAMGKKKRDVMAREWVDFAAGMKANGYSDSAIKVLWDTLAPFADYAFGKSHSAAYAILAYWTAYLKANYPAEYMAALLTSVGDDKTKMALYLSECRRLGIAVLSPDVNASAGVFVADKGTIRFGLDAIRNVGTNVVAAIVEGRQDGSYAEFYDFLARVGPSACTKKAVESLIKAGAFDSMGHTRRGLLAIHADAVDGFTDVKKKEATGQFDLFGMMDDEDDALGMVDRPDIPAYEWDKTNLLALEREMLGMYVSDHPLFGLERALEAAADVPVAEVLDSASAFPDGSTVKLAGILRDVERKLSKSGSAYATATLEDLTGAVDLLVFAAALAKVDDRLRNDSVVVAQCRIDRGEDQPRLIVMSLSAVGDPPAEPAYLTLTLNAKACTEDMVERLRATLVDYPGDTEVRLNLKTLNTTVPLRIARRVKRTPELLRQLKSLLGPQAVN